MSAILKWASAVLMIVCGYVAVTDFMHGRYAWAVIMALCFFLNFRSFRKTSA